MIFNFFPHCAVSGPVFNVLAQFEDPLNQGLRVGRAARDIDIDLDDRIDALHGIITIVELPTGVGATSPCSGPTSVRASAPTTSAGAVPI